MKKGYNTKGKDIILSYLQKHADSNFSANDVYRYLLENNTGMNITTVYRNLDKFVDMGVVMKLKNAEDDRFRYQFKRPDGNCDAHIHMQCRVCGRVFHLECVFMEEISEHLLAHHGFTLESAGSMLSGICTECRGKDMPVFDKLAPSDIEKKSFEIITKELNGAKLPPLHAPIIKRVIHTSADFDYLESLCFSDGAVERLHQAILNGACIVTDTQMAKAGIQKSELAKYGGEVFCFMSDEDVAQIAKERGCTRAAVSMEKAVNIDRPLIFAIGNAPTALIRLYELMEEKKICPAGIIGVPVGFVNVVSAKELIMKTDVPYIVARGRKGGSSIAAAVCNALLYELRDREEK